jgi:hypothetical protein
VNPVISEIRIDSVVASEGLGLKPGACGTMFEDVGDAESRGQSFNPGFQELQIGSVSKSHRVEAIGFAPGNVAWSRPALGVCVLMMADQRLPVGVTGLLD